MFFAIQLACNIIVRHWCRMICRYPWKHFQCKDDFFVCLPPLHASLPGLKMNLATHATKWRSVPDPNDSPIDVSLALCTFPDNTWHAPGFKKTHFGCLNTNHYPFCVATTKYSLKTQKQYADMGIHIHVEFTVALYTRQLDSGRVTRLPQENQYFLKM